jgi:hypothetical protein
MEGRTARFVILAALAACGGDAASAPAQPPPGVVLAMPIRVQKSGSDDTFCPALEVGLARSNLAVVEDASQPVDAVVSCRVFVSEDTGFIKMTYNGQTKVKFTVRIEVRAADGRLVDQFLAEYGGYRRNPPDEDVVEKMVLGFAYSQRIAAFARSAKTRAAIAPTATATSDAPPPPVADRRDDADWFAVDTVKCKIPARVDACDHVRRYLQRHPSGAHAQEANELLNAAQPALEKLQKDDVAWQKSNHSECSRSRTADACVGVEAYEVQFPSGLHIDDAHRLLRNAGVEK